MDPDPVFVDASGRRRLILRWSGIAAAMLLAAYMLVVGLSLISTVKVAPSLSGATDGPADPLERRAPVPPKVRPTHGSRIHGGKQTPDSQRMPGYTENWREWTL